MVQKNEGSGPVNNGTPKQGQPVQPPAQTHPTREEAQRTAVNKRLSQEEAAKKRAVQAKRAQQSGSAAMPRTAQPGTHPQHPHPNNHKRQAVNMHTTEEIKKSVNTRRQIAAKKAEEKRRQAEEAQRAAEAARKVAAEEAQRAAQAAQSQPVIDVVDVPTANTTAPESGSSTPPANPFTSMASQVKTKSSTIGELFSKLSDQIRELIQGEITLAKAKAQAMVARIGAGVVLLAIAGVLALYMLGVLLYAAIDGLAVAVGAHWLSALIIAAIMLLIILILALIGAMLLKKGTKDKPEPQTGMKKNVEALKEGLQK